MVELLTAVFSILLGGWLVYRVTSPKPVIKFHLSSSAQIIVNSKFYDGEEDTVMIEYAVGSYFRNDGLKTTSMVKMDVNVITKEQERLHERSEAISGTVIANDGKPIFCGLNAGFEVKYKKAEELMKTKEIIAQVTYHFVGHKNITRDYTLEKVRPANITSIGQKRDDWVKRNRGE